MPFELPPCVTTRHCFRSSVLGLGLALGLAATPARAGNEDEFFVGNRAAMTAGAVTATVSDGSAAFSNPAGLANSERSRLDVSASVYCLRLYRAPRFLTADGGASQDVSVSEFVAIPTEVAYQRRLAEGVALGLGYFVPRSSDFVLRANLDVPSQELSSSSGLNMRQSRTDYLFVAALGLKMAPWLRFGFGGAASLENEVDAASVFGTVRRDGMSVKSRQVDQFLTAWVVGIELSAGMQFEVTPELVLGVTLRSPRLRVWQSLDGRSNASSAATLPSQTLHAESFAATDAGAALAFVRAGRYIGGMALRLGAGTLNADIDAQPGLVNAKEGIDRLFTLNARVGYSYEIQSALDPRRGRVQRPRQRATRGEHRGCPRRFLRRHAGRRGQQRAPPGAGGVRRLAAAFDGVRAALRPLERQHDDAARPSRRLGRRNPPG
ncbi:MAG: hypothetical protein QM756_12995 [Polyangiaceae bacterium]